MALSFASARSASKKSLGPPSRSRSVSMRSTTSRRCARVAAAVTRSRTAGQSRSVDVYDWRAVAGDGGGGRLELGARPVSVSGLRRRGAALRPPASSSLRRWLRPGRAHPARSALTVSGSLMIPVALRPTAITSPSCSGCGAASDFAVQQRLVRRAGRGRRLPALVRPPLEHALALVPESASLPNCRARCLPTPVRTPICSAGRRPRRAIATRLA